MQGDSNDLVSIVRITAGGYNFIKGAGGWDSGDIFIDVNGDAKYGVDSFGLYDGLSSNHGVQNITNAYGYDYVLDLDLASINLTYAYKFYTL